MMSNSLLRCFNARRAPGIEGQQTRHGPCSPSLRSVSEHGRHPEFCPRTAPSSPNPNRTVKNIIRLIVAPPNMPSSSMRYSTHDRSYLIVHATQEYPVDGILNISPQRIGTTATASPAAGRGDSDGGGEAVGRPEEGIGQCQ
jgi:hypothetical protein